MNARKEAILYVDDDTNNLLVFNSAFIDHFEVVTCSSPKEALAILEEREFPIVIADQRMPEMKGVELLEIVKQQSPLTIRMILTAYTDVGDVLDAINRGNVYKYITKPWRAEDLLLTLHRAIEAYHLALKNQQLTEQLIQAAKLSALGQFAAGIAHEIRNQLGAITLAELIQEEYPDDERLQRYAGAIMDARGHLLGIVSEVRDFSKNVEPHYEKTPFELAEIVESALSLTRYDMDFRRKEVTSDYVARPVIICDRGKIRQVLINLLRNAAHATDGQDPAGIRVEVLEDSEYGIIRVTDNGCGIPPESLDKIWEPFFTTKEDVGTGLGLDICKKIIEAHDGRIECESEPGSGTTFAVMIPLKK